MTHLDFGLLPHSSELSQAPFWGPDRTLNATLAWTGVRYHDAVKFCFDVVRQSDDDINDRERFLRAALTAYVAMEDAARSDLGIDGLRIYELSESPLLNITRILRNINVHLSPLELAKNETEMTWAGKTFSTSIFTIKEVDPQDFWNAGFVSNNYDRQQIDDAVEWFSTNQSHFGAADLVRRACDQYATLIEQQITKTP